MGMQTFRVLRPVQRRNGRSHERLLGLRRLDFLPERHQRSKRLDRLNGSEIRYLAFQIFIGTDDPGIPFDTVVHYTAKDKVEAVVQDILSTIGARGQNLTRLAFMVGPISPDLTDEEAVQTIDDAFDIAVNNDIAVGFHLDDSMFWSRRADLMSNVDNFERVDFDGALSTGLKLDWAHPPAKMCLNAPEIRSETTRRARDVIGATIAGHVAALVAAGKGDLFAGVIAGWETHMGQDVATSSRLGFCALHNRGFGPGNPPSDVSGELAATVQEFIDLWASGLAAAGIDPTRIYSHVAFLSKASFDLLAQDPNFPPIDYQTLVDSASSSQRPSVAFGPNHRPGFSTYPDVGVFEQIQEELAAYRKFLAQ